MGLIVSLSHWMVNAFKKSSKSLIESDFDTLRLGLEGQFSQGSEFMRASLVIFFTVYLV